MLLDYECISYVNANPMVRRATPTYFVWHVTNIRPITAVIGTRKPMI